MRQVARDLFRAGNRSSARLDVLRPSIDIVIENRNGVEWALKKPGDGASTLETPVGLRGGKWWKLSASSTYDETVLELNNDEPGHWVFEPVADMPKATYVAALATVNTQFVLLP